jgi:glycosyltransferase involved in cell wall biosynthesis
MNTLSVIVITYNEENNIKECLKSLKWADEIIIVDSNSKDKTIELASAYTDKIYKTGSQSYAQKRNLGIDKATGEWILWVDADERISEELREEISAVISHTKQDYKPYLIKRKSFFINKFINHCGWYPDYSLRLFKKSTGIRFNIARVHERPIYKGNTAKLSSEIVHYTDLTIEHYINKLNSYTTASAVDSNEQGKKSGIFDIIFRPAFTFIKMYFFKLGLLDGYTGLVLCTLSSAHVFFKYSKLYYLNNKK